MEIPWQIIPIILFILLNIIGMFTYKHKFLETTRLICCAQISIAIIAIPAYIYYFIDLISNFFKII